MKLAPLLISTLLLLGIFVERQSRPRPEDASEFHAQVRAAVDAAPYRFDSWEGADIPVPAAAQALLRPNAMLSRAYRHPATGREASLMVVQCQDTRDMQGHYPPNCYPSHGWEAANPPADTGVRLEGISVPLRRYEYLRKGLDRRAQVVIYSFFILPARGFALDMDTVRREASDYRTRSFGAAQIQVVMDAGGPQAEEEAVVAELLAPLGPTIRLLRSGPSGALP